MHRRSRSQPLRTLRRRVQRDRFCAVSVRDFVDADVESPLPPPLPLPTPSSTPPITLHPAYFGAIPYPQHTNPTLSPPNADKFYLIPDNSHVDALRRIVHAPPAPPVLPLTRSPVSECASDCVSFADQLWAGESVASEADSCSSTSSRSHIGDAHDLPSMCSLLSGSLLRLPSTGHPSAITSVRSYHLCDADEASTGDISRDKPPLFGSARKAARNLIVAPPAPPKFTFKPLALTESMKPHDESLQRQTSAISPPRRKAALLRRLPSLTNLSSSSSSTSICASRRSSASSSSKLNSRRSHSQSASQSQSIAGAAAGLFRKKRSSSCDDSVNSNSTDYYEDEYTRFIEKRSSSVSSKRLSHNSYLHRMMSSDRWSVRNSRFDFGSHSSMSVTTSDEEYAPHLMAMARMERRRDGGSSGSGAHGT